MADPFKIAVALHAIDLAVKWAGAEISRRRSKDDHVEFFVERDSEAGLSEHLAYIKNWCREFLLPDMTHTRAAADTFVMPRLVEGVAPRDDACREYTYQSFLSEGRNRIVYGQPGAGKTTLVQRLCRDLLISATPEASLSQYEFPLLVRLRAVDAASSLSSTLLHAIGVRISYIQKDLTKEQRKRFDANRALLRLRQIEESTIVQYLNDRCVLVLLDGFDELPPQTQTAYRRELDFLSHRIERSDFIITARVGTTLGPLCRLDQFAIQPFSEEDAALLVAQWFKDDEFSAKFWAELEKTPYRGTAFRPLTLASLCVLYQRYDELPSPPSEMYRRIVHLYLEKWDDINNVKRVSKYGKFDVGRKREFLGLLAFHLTITGRGTEFLHSDLKNAYEIICDRFQLPKGDAHKVASEIESHTGLLLEAGFARFQFYHKTVQEFLCAEVIARLPMPYDFAGSLLTLPDECAIAFSLTADPSSYLAMLVDMQWRRSHSRDMEAREQAVNYWTAFLERCLLECATLIADAVTARCILAIASLQWIPTNEHHIDGGQYLPVPHERFQGCLMEFGSVPRMKEQLMRIWGVSDAYDTTLCKVMRHAHNAEMLAFAGRFKNVPPEIVVDRRMVEFMGL